MGVNASEKEIDNWAAEAEEGYDVAALKRKGRGRPGRGALPTQVIAVRLTTEELEQVDRRAAESGITRSEVIRNAIASSAA